MIKSLKKIICFVFNHNVEYTVNFTEKLNYRTQYIAVHCKRCHNIDIINLEKFDPIIGSTIYKQLKNEKGTEQ